jgi:hypothetical protein
MRLADAGSLCASCYKFWAHQGLEPKRMVTVVHDDGRPMHTDAKHIPIVICPHCDGDIILKLKKDANAV